MKKYYGDVVLVTGASSGIGKVCAEYLAQMGYRVYGTSRKAPDRPDGYQTAKGTENNGNGNNAYNPKNEAKSPSIGDAYNIGNSYHNFAQTDVTMIRMDVCSEESVKAAINRIIEAEGEIGIVVNNAGIGIAGSVEDTSSDEAFLQMDTNFFGMHRVIRQVLPHMREKGRGLIINISSVGALFPIPFQSMYVAAKAAVEGMTGSLRNELRPFGIKAAFVEPGDTKTGFTGNRLFVKESGEGSAYRQYSKKSIEVMEKDELNGPDPIVVAKVIARLAKRKNPPVCVTVGLDYKLLVFLKRIVPRSLESFIVSKMYKC